MARGEGVSTITCPKAKTLGRLVLHSVEIPGTVCHRMKWCCSIAPARSRTRWKIVVMQPETRLFTRDFPACRVPSYKQQVYLGA